MAEFAPANHLTGVPSDVWRMECEPGASQDDVHSWSLQYQECDLLFMQGTELQLHMRRIILHMPTSKRFFLDRLDSELLGMAVARQM